MTCRRRLTALLVCGLTGWLCGPAPAHELSAAAVAITIERDTGRITSLRAGRAGKRASSGGGRLGASCVPVWRR